ncbi:MAG: hypothetical protein HYV09_33855 [Deltaproteobacteria bacterium]|nr:hypothetical protein [Deltaproteobacteria bacterium]
MLRPGLLIAFALLVAPLGACSSENDKTDLTTDTGTKKDTGGVKDTAVVEDEGPGTDTGGTVSETGTPVDTGTKTDGGGGGCNAHTGDECDIVKQDCASAAATCVYDNAVSHNACKTLTTGTKLKGESCATQNDCDRGLFCYGGKCSPACCSGDNSVCGAGGTCNLAITASGGAVIYYACSYSDKCNPFKYDCPTGQVCLFSSEPDSFKCSTPSAGTPLAQGPGNACEYANDCGESQSCFKLSSGGDAAGATYKCYLFCWLSKPDAWTPGATPGGRFPADGTCTIGGTNYGTCQSVGGIGGGLGICVK